MLSCLLAGVLHNLKNCLLKAATVGLPGILAISLLSVGVAGCGSSEAVTRLRVATTTSLYDTGFWEYIEPLFEDRYDIELDVIYAGTGRALEYGRRGDVDIVVVHSPAREQQFVAAGYGVERVPFACNYFLVVGPVADPAGIKGLGPEEAFSRLMDTGKGSFVSRGDDSGTHAREQAIWEEAGYDYAEVRNAGAWYIEAGTGMGPALMMAGEKQAYTLSDLGTYLAYQGKLELVPVIDGGNSLLNVYSAIAVNPKALPEVRADMADKLIGFLISPQIQELIGEYGIEEYGVPLFTPCAGTEPG